MPCNIIDVARKAGVSHTTVSRILRNVKGFSYAPGTRDKVINTAREMRYAPNLAAQFMRLKKTKMIGITTQPQNAYATYRLIEKCSVKIRALGYSPVMIDLSEGNSETGNFLNISHLAGAICMYQKHERELAAQTTRRGLNMPIITVRRKVTKNPAVRMVTSDNVKGLEKAFKYLYDLGHRSIGYLGHKSSSASRQSFYSSICRKFGTSPQIFSVDVLEESNPFIGGMEKARALVNKGRITAVLCEDDEFAAGLIAGLSDLKVKVPKDMSVIGFDDLPFSTAIRPRLTTVGVQMDQKADAAVRLLIALIEGNDNQKELMPKSIILDCDLIIRDSTAKAG